jgi:SAM-dependent methyltransferase
MHLPHVHLCIVQPQGYLHSLGFLDQARFFRHQFRRMGADVTLAKNRLRHDAVNFVFGAHLGFDAELRARHSCIFVNLEQLGPGGATVSGAYRALLGRSAVVDYDLSTVAAYTAHVDDVPLISFAHAPYLEGDVQAIEDRPIDILFFGSVNARRERLIQQVESSGRQVTVLGAPLYGPERDELIRQAKAVFNCHYYDTARFEQARAFQCLSLGTPVISEWTANTQAPAQFEDAVFWVSAAELGNFFAQHFGGAEFASRARRQMEAFRAHDVVEQYADALAFAAGYRKAHAQRVAAGPWRPTRLQIGSGKDYRPGWFNVDVLNSAQPDALLDLSKPQAWPQRISSDTLGEVELSEGSVDTIYANNVLEHVADLPQLMSNCLLLLREGGEMQIEVPHEQARTAWQDPTHVRAMNANSWIYYADRFWYLGWFDWRFQVRQLVYLDAGLNACGESAAHFMRVSLVKVATTLSEKMTARAMQADFGGVPNDSTFTTKNLPVMSLAMHPGVANDSADLRRRIDAMLREPRAPAEPCKAELQ